MNSVLKIVIAMTIWGSVGLFVKNISLPSIEIAFLRGAIGIVFLLIVSFFMKNKTPKGEKEECSKRNIILLGISGIALALNWLLLFQAYKYTTVANATLSYYAAPVFVVLLSPIVLKENLTFKKLISVLIAMGGLVLIMMNQPETNTGNYMHTKGISYGLSAAVAYASVVLLNKSIKGFSSYYRTTIQMIISTLILVPIVFFRGNIHITGINMIINILILGVFHTGLAYLLYFSSIQNVSAQRVSVLSYIDPISAIILGTLFLGEPLTIYHVIGGICILFSTFEKQA